MIMKKIIVIVVAVFTTALSSLSQDIYPTHWWVGMKEPKLQLMIHRDRVGMEKISMLPYPGVKMVKQSKAENANYLFIDLVIDKNAKPGKIKFRIDNLQSPEAVAFKSFEFELKSRSNQNGKTRVQGVNASDFVYLMIPDRFANGDPSNDMIPGYREQANDRTNKFARHGGDFKGIQDHLDYFNQLGVTTIWMTPVIENNTSMMHEWGNNIAGYHGYWFTDHYQIDKRLGGNDGYKQFCDVLHSKGMKVIQDAVYNHVSKQNWFVLDPPMKDWINNWPTLTTPNHREEVLFDPYASAHDKKIMLDGWFTDHLPDLNQRNPFVANFLIQHAIWTTEEYGIDGWRVDTYKYCDEDFLNRVNVALEKEFPKITVFGEAWVNTIMGNAYFTRNNINSPFKHNAQGVIDFQTCFAILAGMNEPFGWTNGINKIYMTMAQDVVYKDPMNNCIFMDNHDMDRVFSVVGEDWSKLKMGITWLLTLRGIPQFYYGTEILMKNFKATTDAMVREDFPGGWKDDAANKFTAAGRTAKENEAFNFTSALGRFRRSSSAITTGKTMQFIPKDGVYIYFRYDNKQTVMVIANTSDKAVKPDWNIYNERTKGFSQLKEVTSGQIRPLAGFEIQPKESYVFEMVK
jgi:glycosidase